MGARNKDIGKIIVRLPVERPLAGNLTVYHRSGRSLFSCAALGKADSQRAVKEDNPTRDPTRPYGDAPWGDYTATRPVIFDTPHRRLGKGWIPLLGVFGDAWLAVERGRTGLGIHAGRGDKKLIPTYGCTRILDASFDALVDLWGDQMVSVFVINI